ncbi:hypothetical protein F511_34114 [Dorcoceras hygrometricum]|uniref:Uncharacterized protein n=1 Tax=Dorcoceras hygrometricum TaxID=472368 RepID=A0A2Z7AU01_9LAMI|nr:hypothetical protein F511_34114 [Dorcoceras hygrometricum]
MHSIHIIRISGPDALCVDSSRKRLIHQLDNQTQAIAHPVESFYEPAVAMNPVASFAYPVDMESSRKKADVMESYNLDARFQSQYLKIQQKRKAAVDMNQQQSS